MRRWLAGCFKYLVKRSAPDMSKKLTEVSTPDTPDDIPERGALGFIELWAGRESVEETNPTVAVLVARAIALWANVEVSIAALANRILKGDFPAVSSILSGITGRYRLRGAIVRAAEAAGVAPQKVELIRRTLKQVNRAGERRRVYAHHIWARSPHHPEWLFLIPPESMGQNLAEDETMLRLYPDWWREADGSPPISDPEAAPEGWYFGLPDDGVMAFTEAHVEQDCRAMVQAQYLVRLLSHALSDEPTHDEARTLLVSLLP